MVGGLSPRHRMAAKWEVMHVAGLRFPAPLTDGVHRMR